jgi:hypothetical protein
MNKEQYLKAVESWKDTFKYKKHKKYKVYYDVWDRKENRTIKNGGYLWQSDIDMYHHAFYAILRKKSLLTGFKDNDILAKVISDLKSCAKYAEPFSENWATKFTMRILAPFNRMSINIDVESFKQIVNEALN